MRKGMGFLVLLFFLLEVYPSNARAEGNEVKEVFVDGFYGALAGTLVGAAFLAFTSHPEDHLENLAIGAGVGALVGTVYGIAKASSAFAEIDHGRLVFHVPTIKVDLSAKKSRTLWSTDLFRYNF
ncbi:MAG TPA: hypothetical protein VFG95_08625 [Nitrospiria bacterium]|nr:hypothetical protein [Nitrospiria bacterium]